jgi:2-dehydro-3-deoxyphosphooctonate aldolase (KDO 8-P synthase)
MTVPNPIVRVGGLEIANTLPFVLIAGPDSMESRAHALEMASALKEITSALGIGLIYKSSFDKANRTSGASFRGIGMETALPVFAEIKSSLGLPVLTDVHSEAQCALAAEICDVLQIPAFLSRQTDLLVAAAETGRALHVKKGQFLAPWDMTNVVGKITAAGGRDIICCERGVTFGYNLLINDMRALVQMRETGAPVGFDATHSVQQPSGLGTSSGGQREMIPVLARAAVAVGIASLFMEVHQDPDTAPCDGPSMLPLAELPALLKTLQALDRIAKAG